MVYRGSLEIDKTPTIQKLRVDCAATMCCLPQQIMLLYGGMELHDSWDTDDVFTGEKEAVLAVPRDQRRAILTHLKEHVTKEVAVDIGHSDDALKMDSLMTRVLGHTAETHAADPFLGVPDIPMEVVQGPDLMPTEPRAKGIVEAQGRLAKQMAMFEEEKYRMFSTRFKERAVLLQASNLSLKKLYRENMFLRDLCEDAFYLERDAKPIAVTEDSEVNKAYLAEKEQLALQGGDSDDDDNLSQMSGASAGSAKPQSDVAKSTKRRIGALLREFSAFLAVRETKEIWNVKLAQRKQATAPTPCPVLPG